MAVAIGLNPFVGTFMLTTLAAFTRHVPEGAAGAFLPGDVWSALAALTGMLIPVDVVLAKFVRFAPAVRRLSQACAAAGGALAATIVTQSELPLPVIAAGCALLAWLVAAMTTRAAARASRAAAWVGLGHIPVLMSAATAAACIVPLTVAKPVIGGGLAGGALIVLMWATLVAWRPVLAAIRQPGRTAFPRASGAAVRVQIR